MKSGGKSANSATFPPSKQPPQLNLHQAFNDFQTHCSNLFTHVSHHLTAFNPEAHPRSTLCSLQTDAKNALDANLSHFNSWSAPKALLCARAGNNSHIANVLAYPLRPLRRNWRGACVCFEQFC
ncbi:hypothetical protein SLE2022_152560 [Rubroshorea leprosula]